MRRSGLYFQDRDIPTMEGDHIVPKSLGGKDGYENLQLLHGHCHDEKTSLDGSTTKGLLRELEKRYAEAGKNRGQGIGKIHPNWKRLTKFQMLEKAYENEEERRIATSKLALLQENLTEDEYKEVVEI